jgi:hypothetical protein
MGLREVQGALARLFTDAALRGAFLSNPAAAGTLLGLDANDAAVLASLAPQGLRQFADSLRSKRLLDARKTMPLTARVLGEGFAEHLNALQTQEGADRAGQALGLAARLAALAQARSIAPAWVGDLARYEAAFVAAAPQQFALRVARFAYPVGLIAASLQADVFVADVAPRTTIGVWARRRAGRLFHRLYAFGR